MSRLMIVVEFEVKPEHRNTFVELMKNHAKLSRADFAAAGLEQVDAALEGTLSAVRDVRSVEVLAEILSENLKSVALRKGARR